MQSSANVKRRKFISQEPLLMGGISINMHDCGWPFHVALEEAIVVNERHSGLRQELWIHSRWSVSVWEHWSHYMVRNKGNHRNGPTSCPSRAWDAWGDEHDEVGNMIIHFSWLICYKFVTYLHQLQVLTRFTLKHTARFAKYRCIPHERQCWFASELGMLDCKTFRWVQQSGEPQNFQSVNRNY